MYPPNFKIFNTVVLINVCIRKNFNNIFLLILSSFLINNLFTLYLWLPSLNIT